MDGIAHGFWTLHLAGTWYMTGLIWFVQRVHYPLMNRVDPAAYAAFQSAHMLRTTHVVGPVMLLEAFTGAALLYVPYAPFPMSWAIVNMGLLLAIWISTAALQVPCHHRLRNGLDHNAHKRLVRTNWLRTALWTVRAVGLLVVVLR